MVKIQMFFSEISRMAASTLPSQRQQRKTWVIPREKVDFLRIPLSHDMQHDCAIQLKCIDQPRLKVLNEKRCVGQESCKNTELISRTERPLVIRHNELSRVDGRVNDCEDSEPAPEPRNPAKIQPHAQHSIAHFATTIPESTFEPIDDISTSAVRPLPDVARSSSLLSVPTLNSTLKLRQKVAEAERNKAAAAAAAMEAQMVAEMRRLEFAGRANAGGAQEEDQEAGPGLGYRGLIPIADPADAASAAAAGNIVLLVPRRVGKQVDARWQAALRDPPTFDALHRPVLPPTYRSVPPLPRPELDPPFSLSALRRPGDGGSLAGSAFPGSLMLLDADAGGGFSPAALGRTPDDWW